MEYQPDPARVVNDAWCRILDVDQAADEDDFFVMGGDSLAAVRLVEAVESALDVEFPLETFFLDGRLITLVTSVTQRYALAGPTLDAESGAG